MVKANRPLLAIFWLAAIASPAFAQTVLDRERGLCANQDDHLSLDTQIVACTHVIQTSNQASDRIAAAYNNRANAFRDQGNFDMALSDYAQAIRLKPDYANAFNNRGIAYRAQHDYARAMADFNEAIRLDPNVAGVFLNR